MLWCSLPQSKHRTLSLRACSTATNLSLLCLVQVAHHGDEIQFAEQAGETPVNSICLPTVALPAIRQNKTALMNSKLLMWFLQLN